MMLAKLSVHRIKNRSMVLGPGRRCVIWFHGCTLDCPGCIAYEMNRSVESQEFSARNLCDRVFAIEGIEGITLTGGDPMDQPLDALLQFAKTIKAESNLSIMCYTGRTMSELRARQDSVLDKLIDQFDLLIDGRYEHDRNSGLAWRGSSNQRIWYLSSRYEYLRESIENQAQREIEIEVGEDNELTIAGIPPQGFMRNLRKNLASRGLELNGRR